MREERYDGRTIPELRQEPRGLQGNSLPATQALSHLIDHEKYMW
jgi:hypothetical protein